MIERLALRFFSGAVGLALLCLASPVLTAYGAQEAGRPASQSAGTPAPQSAGSGEARIVLPPVDKTGGMPLMAALALRKSDRDINPAALPLQEVSNLLWAAYGVNRPDGRRTMPTARNRQSLKIFAAFGGKVWEYDGEKHELAKVSDQDLGRELGGAPLTLVYADDAEYGPMHVGSAYQNVGLYCASAGLANVVKATGAQTAAKALKLPSGFKVHVIQQIGTPRGR